LQIFFSPKRTFLTQKSLFKKYPFESRSPALARGEVGAWGIFFILINFSIHRKTNKMNIPEPIQQLVKDMITVKGGTLKRKNKEDDKLTSIDIKDFKISKYPITQEQWTAVIGNNPSNFKSIGSEKHPVEKVRWDDVQDFIEKLNESTDKNFRLPTVDKWEFAAKGGNMSKGCKYAGSDIIDDVAWYLGNSDRMTHPVGEKDSNELGIHDMSGNVWEWCQDMYNGDRFRELPEEYRMTCGGSWFDDDKFCESTVKKAVKTSITEHIDHIGFRLICD